MGESRESGRQCPRVDGSRCYERVGGYEEVKNEEGKKKSVAMLGDKQNEAQAAYVCLKSTSCSIG